MNKLASISLTRFASIAGLSLLAAVSGSASGAVIYVNASSATIGNGSSWAQSTPFLTDALAMAQPGDEIWVAQGTYYPDTSGATPSGSGLRESTFSMKTRVHVYGGFTGSETQRSQRNPAANITILSGDIGVRDSHGDNAYSVLTADNVLNTSLLDGFKVIRGQADAGTGQPVLYSLGGGMYVTGGQGPTINNCSFEDNFARGGGGISVNNTTGTIITNTKFYRNNGSARAGGIELSAATNAQIADCYFEANRSGYGGGFYANFSSTATVDRCRFQANLSVNGGGMSLAGFSAITVRNSWFVQNESKQLQYYQTSWDGGGVRNWCTPSTFINCVFSGNRANGKGAGLYDAGPSGSSATVINCTFHANWSRDGGTLTATSGHTTTVRNSIAWGNSYGSNPVNLDGSFNMTNSNVQGFGGATNMNSDPQFKSPAGLDGIAGTPDDDLSLLSTSPLIDMGDNSLVPVGITTDILGNARLVDGDDNGSENVDLGAFEFAPPPPPPCYGDANHDRQVNFTDITTVLLNFGGTGPDGDADYNNTVSFPDITAILIAWSVGCDE